MFVDIGYYCLLAAIVLTLHSIIASLAGAGRNSLNLIKSARFSVVGSFILIAVSYLALSYAFAVDDFSVRFVADHSSTDLPMFYKLTAVWGGMEGSLLFWEAVLVMFSGIVVLRYSKSNKDILPFVIFTLGVISLFLLFLLIGWSNPFARVFPVPLEGRGLNPLLQNPGMVFHPPSLYLGYVGYSVPFAFAMAALIKGKLNNEWILTTRRWSLFSWFFLTAGMLLGGEWAYMELGWGGYWAWDPVENASLMPWLTGTAFLHSVIVQEKRNSLKIWNMLLIIGTFTLSILGTFITRSGVLNSVHAFSKSPIGPAFLVFIAFIMVVAHGLLFYRQAILSSKAQKAGILSRENSFLLNNIFFVGMAFTVLYGTIFPLLAEGLADKKISIQAPFFNSIMTPLAILTVFLLGMSQVLGWKKTSMDMLKKNTWVVTLLTLIFMVVSGFIEAVPWQMTFLGGMTFFAGYLVIREFFFSILKKKHIDPKTQSEKKSLTFFKKVWTDRRRRGGIVIHFGMIVFLVGVCGNFFAQETSFSAYPGETTAFGDYSMTFKHTMQFQELNAKRVAARFEIKKGDRVINTLLPAKAYYPTSPEPMTEVAIHRSVAEDLYLSLSTINKDGSVTVNAYINPLINFVWASMLFVTIGMVFSISHKSLQLKKKPISTRVS
ncbi:MAG: heme lyase CcmF/NrfE family subunit [Deltaproteobacteria bacterium]|nr:heme lyase CcmF/NrfE family subunit [Deltaproteobacteria bacterium]